MFPSVDCASSCLADADFDGCNSTDDTCLCKSSTFVNSVTSCIESSCSGNDLQTAEADAQQLCLAVVRALSYSARYLGLLTYLSSQGVTLTASASGASSTSPSASKTSASA